MKNNSGYTLIELVVSTAVILTLLVGGVSTLKSDSDIIKQAKQASSIAFDVNKGISSALLLKRTGGCLNGVSISHADLLGIGVPRASVYPTPWITNFSFSMRGGEPVGTVVSVDVRDTILAAKLFSESGARSVSGSLLSFYYPIRSPRISSFSEMYRNNSSCWEYGSGAK